MNQHASISTRSKSLEILFVVRARLYRVFKVLLRLPPVRRFLWKRWYQFLSGTYSDPDWSFLNYGFTSLEPDAPRLELSEEDEPDRYFIQLYHAVAGAVDVHGKTVLEVGCGRGGGAAYIKRYLQPSLMTGIDFSSKAIDFCRSVHIHEGLVFIQGNAERLPIEDQSQDVVLSVESSHCYGSIPTFLNEVARVLKPGGYCLLSDLRFIEDVETLRDQLSSSPLILLNEKDISQNVLGALEADSERRLAILKERLPKHIVESAGELVGAEGTKIREGLQKGTIQYLSFVLKKRG